MSCLAPGANRISLVQLTLWEKTAGRQMSTRMFDGLFDPMCKEVVSASVTMFVFN